MDFKKFKDTFFFPYRLFFLLDDKNTLGLTNLQDERIGITLKYAKGNLLDVGCGNMNKTVRRYHGFGVGLDVYPWEGIDVMCDTRYMPFPKNAFDTISFVASFNHIPQSYVEEVLTEVKSVLKDDGLLLITMVNPVISWINHKWHYRHDIDQKIRGMEKDEVWGYWHGQMLKLLSKNGFTFIKHVPFLYYLSNLYISKKMEHEEHNTVQTREI